MTFSKILLVGTAFIMTSSAIADETPIEIISITGSSFQVSPSEVKNAYIALTKRKSKNAEKIAANEDGSAAITRPYFEYNGKLLRIDWNYYNAQGVCKRFGFGKNVGQENQRITSDATIAVLNEDGKLQNLIHTEEPKDRTVLETVACQ